jgi:MFS family permease
VWQLSQVESFGAILTWCVLYSMIYSPTLPLTNALAFTHLPDRDRDFGRIRVWGTIGGIVAGIGVGQWLLHQHTPAFGAPEAIRAAQVAGMADAFRFSALIGIVQALFCLTLPATPPRRGPKKFAPGQATARFKLQPLRTLLLVAFIVSCMHQFYIFHSAGFLSRLEHPWTPYINKIFGVGGGGLMSIGHMSIIVVLGFMPLLAKRLSRKTLLTIGILAYIVRFAVFAYAPSPVTVIPALALEGLCFGCFFFVAFMIVDEETSPDIRASAQAIFNITAFGLAVIVGNVIAAMAAQVAGRNYALFFAIPMWVCVGCLILLLLLYPRKPVATA